MSVVVWEEGVTSNSGKAQSSPYPFAANTNMITTEVQVYGRICREIGVDRYCCCLHIHSRRQYLQLKCLYPRVHVHGATYLLPPLSGQVTVVTEEHTSVN